MLSNFEKKVFKQGYAKIAGIDEAGRGPLAGPVAAAVVMMEQKQAIRGLKIRDSKSLSAKQREEVFERIKQEPRIEWQVSFVWPKIIDRHNIWQATLLAWRRCLKKLESSPDFLFLDGNQKIPRLNIEQTAIVKGDQKIMVLSLASVVAKVNRDRLMARLAKKYPAYDFERHKGYGTVRHLEKLKKFGPSEIHRKSFQPVFENLSFGDKVYYAVSQIQKGETLTYQEVARKIGHPQAYRAVGSVLNKNYNPKIPCHRVIRSNGKFGGYNRGEALKVQLLAKECILGYK